MLIFEYQRVEFVSTNVCKLIMKRIITFLTIFVCVFSYAKVKPDADLSKKADAIYEACPKAPAVKVLKPRKILIFSRTKGWRHTEGIPAAKMAYKYMGDKLGTWQTVISDDLENFTPENIKQFDCIVLNNSTGMCFGESPKELAKMPEAERKAILKKSDEICANVIEYVKNGGSIFAIHGGVDCYNHKNIRNDAFVEMLGGEFISHPWFIDNKPVTFVIDDMQSPITKGIWDTDNFKIRDEIYLLGKSYDRKKCRVLMRIDTKRSPITRKGQNKIYPEGDYATAYIKSFGKGRIAYTVIGHAENNYLDKKCQEFHLRMLQFCCGDLKADTTSIDFTKK